MRLDTAFVIDLRYATDNNFVDTIMYDCGRCFLRPRVAQAVLEAQKELQEQGYRLMMLDCYRPRPVQWRLWKKVPDPRFVSDPIKGSMHNRGAAVDLTLADADGHELDMGTPFDFFGPEAYPAYTAFPDSILERRKLLSETLTRHGFRAIRTEWWHFAFVGGGYALADWE
ncbi:MAG: M15 family metallopeptidase, partial [Lewinella sp.]|nr:M15 family metallopeptidase [Lewinella sp.]